MFLPPTLQSTALIVATVRSTDRHLLKRDRTLGSELLAVSAALQPGDLAVFFECFEYWGALSVKWEIEWYLLH